jgi:hypothetical protein
MPRTMRVEYSGAIYHVMIRLRWGSDAMNRGDRWEDILVDDVDRQDFLKALAEACQKPGSRIHAMNRMRRSSEPPLRQPRDRSILKGLLNPFRIELTESRRCSTGRLCDELEAGRPMRSAECGVAAKARLRNRRGIHSGRERFAPGPQS